MKSVNEMYKGSFFSRRHKLSWRVPYVCNAVVKTFNFKSIVDVGCGIGDYVKGFLDVGLDAYGVEGSENCLPYLMAPERRVFIKDIRAPIVFRKFDFVLCLEVFEHIDPEYAEIMVCNLINMSDRILTSAAPPGQGGHYHLNCQPKSWWQDRLANHNYHRKKNIEKLILKEWEPVKHKKEMSAYYNNLMYYEKLDL